MVYSTVDNNISLINPNIVNSKCIRRRGNRSIDETSDKTSYCVKINNDNDEHCEDVTVSSIFPYVEKGLRVACHNINRLINKLDELKLILDTDKSPLGISKTSRSPQPPRPSTLDPRLNFFQMFVYIIITFV